MIWSPGLQYREAILELINAEDNFEIVEEFDYCPSNLREFVTEMYKYDSIPKGFIDGKINKVSSYGPAMVIIYFKHYDPDFVTGPSGYVDGVTVGKSKRIQVIKDTVRKRYVPGDNMWAISLIHASDFEEQVDLLLKLLDHPEGIEYLYSTYGRPGPALGTFGNWGFVPPEED